MGEQKKQDPDELDSEKIEDLEVPAEDADDVRGGRAGDPSGPVPIPYPN